MYNKWTQQDIEQLKRLYPTTLDWNTLQLEFPFSTKRGIQGKATALGLRKPRLSNAYLSHDEVLFSSWTEKSAYLLGYLEADGYFKDDKCSLRVTFATSPKDLSFLELLKQMTGFTGKISKRIHHLKTGNYKSNSFTISSRQWKKDLEGKYRINRIPAEIPEGLLHHYIRGYFDGDGSIYFETNSNRKFVSFVFSSEQLAKTFQQRIIQYIGFSEGIKVYKKHKAECWYFRIAKQELVSKLGTWIYKNATIYLQRKRDKFANV